MKKNLLLLLTLTLITTSNYANAETTIYLVRHAEKITNSDTKDPELTAIGKFRAQNIAKQLSQVGITEIYSTQFKRTLQTAKPLANFLNFEIKDYDPSKLVEFAKQVQTMQGHILIVGHSNTTPKLTSLLSGQKIKLIAEDEYDNLYQVIITEQQTILNKFKTIPSYALNTSESGPQPRLNKNNSKAKQTNQ